MIICLDVIQLYLKNNSVSHPMVRLAYHTRINIIIFGLRHSKLSMVLSSYNNKGSQRYQEKRTFCCNTVWSVAQCGCKIWTISARDERRLKAFAV